MRVLIELASPRPGDWYVVSEGTYLVGFSGLHARELAVKHQQELTQLLNAAALGPESRAEDDRSTVTDIGYGESGNLYSDASAPQRAPLTGLNAGR